MAKRTGIGANLYLGTADVSGAIGNLSKIETSRAEITVTTIDQAGEDRLPGRRDGGIDYESFWDTTLAHAVLSALPTTDILTSVWLSATLDDVCASMIGKQVSYAPQYGADGSLAANISAVANGYGLEWGESLTTGKQSFGTGTVDATAIDSGASSAFGAAAYIHIFSVASGTAVFAVQDSSDNMSFTDVVGLVFTGATGATTQRLQTAAGLTVKRYIRLEGRGTHGAAVVAVNFVRYTEAGPV